MRRLIRSAASLVLALGLGILVLAGPAALASDVVASYSFGDRPLEWGHANKIIKGRYNSLHVTYVSLGEVLYTTSSDGSSWSNPVVLGSEQSSSQAPAIAATSSGRVAAVWVENADSNGMGEIWYGWRPATTNTWTVSLLTESGLEPAIVASGSRVYVAWSTLDSVRYASFVAHTPPSVPINTGEVVFASSCAISGVRQPAITVVRNPCNPPIVKVAVLYTDNQDCGGGTRVGARVFERDNVNNTWSQVYDGTSTSGSGSAEGVSISMSAHYTSGNTFLSWSDEQNGVARTMVAHGSGASWTSEPFEAARLHVHLRAQTSTYGSAVNAFRMAWVGSGVGSDEFYSYDANFRPGSWPLGGALYWSGGAPLSLAPAGRPQTIYWQRCTSSSSAYLSQLFERQDNFPPFHRHLLSDFESFPMPCLMPAGGGSTLAVACKSHFVGMVGMVLASGRMGTAIDTAELGTVIRVGANDATVETEDKKLVTIRWTGALESYWESGLLLDTSKDRITFSSPDVRFAIEDDGVMR